MTTRHPARLTIPLFLLLIPGCAGPPRVTPDLLVLSDRPTARLEQTRLLGPEVVGGSFRIETESDLRILENSDLYRYQGLILHSRFEQRLTPERERAFLDYISRGHGLVLLGEAALSFPGWDEYRRLAGLTGEIGEETETVSVRFGPRYHPVTNGLAGFAMVSRLPVRASRHSDYEVLAYGEAEERPDPFPLAVAKTYGEGRVFQILIGLPAGEWESSPIPPELALLVKRGIAWTVRAEEVDTIGLE